MTTEIEFKNLLNEEEYELLNNYFNKYEKKTYNFITTYFDTTNLHFKKNYSALRLRKYLNYTELTLKQKTLNNNEHQEISQILTPDEEVQFLSNKKLPAGTVEVACKQLLRKKLILYPLGEITTVRTEIPYKDGLIALDKCYYLHIYDFELEYEVTNYESGKTIFQKLLLDVNIPTRPSHNKIKRFMQRYYELEKIDN